MTAGHAVAIAATALTAVLLPVLVRRQWTASFGSGVRWWLAALLVASVTAYLALATSSGEIGPLDFLPFHLCDLAIFVAVFALLTQSRLACEILYYWALAGTTLAILTPDVSGSFPDWRWVAYFTTHSFVVVSATVLVFGLDRTPRPGSAWRIFLITLVYAAVVGMVDFATGANFLYLARKPSGPTLLDWFGPWPVYIGVAAAVAGALFTLLEMPFRRRSAG
ncbi:MAG: TIGR02206 family membrane protein [Gemmatimonadota bacterium]